MKKLILLIGLTLIFVTTAEAGPFLDINNLVDGTTDTYSITNGLTYTIKDRHQVNNTVKYLNDDEFIYTDNALSTVIENSPLGYTGDNFTGIYLGTIISDNNDSKTDFENLIGFFIDNSSFTIVDENYSSTDDSDPNFTLEFTAMKEADEPIAGTWTSTGNDQEKVAEFYSVKGGDEYALYYVNPAEHAGIWTTAHLLNNGVNIPEISHLSGVITTSTTPPSGGEVPEPATMILVGFGLIGFARIGRGRKIG